MQHGLAGDAERAGGVVEHEVFPSQCPLSGRASSHLGGRS
jgi:hypothetical protein